MRRLSLNIASILLLFLCFFGFNIQAQTQENIQSIQKNAQDENQIDRPKISIDEIEVDVVYKYIDLFDPNLNRNIGSGEIDKDYHNNELKYSLRSVLKNIPWIRKIFIIMPNDEVAFLKDISEIGDKIVYIKDKDFLGFDSCKSEAFQWILWKLKQYGCSNNIVYLDDDCFIGSSMEKSDFFYEDENGKIVPYVLFDRNKISKSDKQSVNNILNKYRNEVNSKDEKAQNTKLFRAQLYSGYSLLFDILKKNELLISGSTLHNAKPINLDELEFLYNTLGKNYEFKDQALRGKFRSKYDIPSKPFYDFYYLNAESRKINYNVNYACFTLKSRNIIKKIKNNKYKLFCINNAGDHEYSDKDKLYVKNVMEKLFPEKTIYEKNDNDEINKLKDVIGNKKSNKTKDETKKENLKAA